MLLFEEWKHSLHVNLYKKTNVEAWFVSKLLLAAQRQGKLDLLYLVFDIQRSCYLALTNNLKKYYKHQYTYTDIIYSNIYYATITLLLDVKRQSIILHLYMALLDSIN